MRNVALVGFFLIIKSGLDTSQNCEIMRKCGNCARIVNCKEEIMVGFTTKFEMILLDNYQIKIEICEMVTSSRMLKILLLIFTASFKSCGKCSLVFRLFSSRNTFDPRAPSPTHPLFSPPPPFPQTHTHTPPTPITLGV